MNEPPRSGGGDGDLGDDAAVTGAGGGTAAPIQGMLIEECDEDGRKTAYESDGGGPEDQDGARGSSATSRADWSEQKASNDTGGSTR